MNKKLLRETRPDVFNMIQDKDTYYNIGTGFQKKINFICPRCGSVVTQRVNNTVRCGLSCKKCGDGISFGEKFIFNLLEQLGIDFDIHVLPDWSDGKIYDVGIYDGDKLVGLVEVNGQQHYGKGFSTCGGRTYQEEVENDEYKYKMALSNGISDDMYVVIDCRISSFDCIKSNIECHAFFQKYDLQRVNWSLCMENAMSSYAMKTWQLWESGYNIGSIAKSLKIDRFTARTYLKQGAKSGLCSYSVEESRERGFDAIRRSRDQCRGAFGRKGIMVASYQLGKIFQSITIAHIVTKISRTSICDCVAGRQAYAGMMDDGTKITWIEVRHSEIKELIDNKGFVLIDNITQQND
jgi:predicted RNA-binding Zn-ribbon protein involved in translation (DUF1610 family)